jgi:hypothetical protein
LTESGYSDPTRVLRKDRPRRVFGLTLRLGVLPTRSARKGMSCWAPPGDARRPGPRGHARPMVGGGVTVVQFKV